MAISPLISNNFIDSCAFDPKYEPESSASNEILRLSEQKCFLLTLAHSTQKEIEHPNTPAWVKQRAATQIFSLNISLTQKEKQLLGDIQTILAGNGDVVNIAQDARHIFEAQKYGTYFITTDNRILARADTLRRCCSLTVLKPSEFLALVKEYIAYEKHAGI